jgi:hypothetical protein
MDATLHPELSDKLVPYQPNTAVIKYELNGEIKYRFVFGATPQKDSDRAGDMSAHLRTVCKGAKFIACLIK